MRDEPMTPEVERELDAIDAALRGEPVEPELTELGALALALREDRPEPDPFFTRELDSRAAAAFPKRKRPSRVAAFLAARPLAIPGVAASMLLALVVAISMIGNDFGSEDSESAGGSGAGGGTVIADGDAAAPEIAEDDAGSADAFEEEGAEDSAQPQVQRAARRKGKTSSSSSSAAALSTTGAQPIAPPASGGGSPRSDGRQARKVERAASLTLAAPPDDVTRVADGIIRVTDNVGGFVVTSAISTGEGGGGGTFELRVPSDRLQDALAQLSRLANVRERQETQRDITQSFVSARERLEDARAERRGLLRALERADTLSESSAIRARLRDVSARINTAKTDLARVNNRASYSTIAVSLSSDASAAEPGEDGSWTPGDAAKDALRVLEVAVGVALVGLAVLAPLALLAVLIAVAAKLTARRRRERALDAAV